MTTLISLWIYEELSSDYIPFNNYFTRAAEQGESWHSSAKFSKWCSPTNKYLLKYFCYIAINLISYYLFNLKKASPHSKFKINVR